MSEGQRERIVRRAVLNTVSNYIGQFAGLAAILLLTPFILHQLGPVQYGLWVLVGSVVAYGSLLDFGIASAITKYVAEYRAKGESEQARALVATALCLYTAIGLGIILLSALLAPLFPDLFRVPPGERETASRLFLLSGIAIGISIPASTPTAVLRGLHRFDIINLLSVCGTLLSATLTVIVLLLDGGVIGLVLVSIGVIFVTQLPSIWFVHRITPELRLGWRGANRRLLRRVTGYGSSLFAIHVGGHLEAKTDEIVIGAFLPLQAVTPYNLARKVSTLPVMLTEQFLMLVLPLASEFDAANSKQRLRTLYLTSTKLTLALFLPVGATLIMLGGAILGLWVGEAYAAYAYLITILTIAHFIDNSQWAAGLVLQGMARHRFMAVVSICTGLLNLALSIVLVQRLGLAGVALGTLIPTTIACLGVVFPYALRVIGVPFRVVIEEVLVPVIKPAIPMLLAGYLLIAMVPPTSLPILAGLAATNLLLYATGYLLLSSSAGERALFRGLAYDSLRLAALRLKRS